MHVSDGYLPRLGGIERQVHDLAARQAQLGHSVRVLTAVAGPSADGLVEIIRPSLRRPGASGHIRYGWARHGCDQRIAREADLVHVHASTWSPLGFLALATAVRAGVPTVVTLHSLWDYAAPLFYGADRLARWSRWPVVWSAVSRVAAAPLERVLGAATRVHRLPNAVDASNWSTLAGPRDPHRVVIANVGRLAARKRPAQLLHVLRQVRAAVPSQIRMEASLVGDGPLRASLQRYVNRHAMQGWVRLHGMLTPLEVGRVLADADIYVAPATLESFGIAALEARCAGLPVVGHAECGIAEFIEHGREGLLGHGDADLVRHLAHLTTHPAALHRMREHNRNTRPSVTWKNVLERCDVLYDEAFEVAGVAASRAALIR